MEDIDFGGGTSYIFLTLFVLGYGAFGIFGAVLAWDDVSGFFRWGEAAGWCVAFSLYAFFFWFILTIMTYAARTRFTDEGIHRWTLLRRYYFVPWKDITAATAGLSKGTIELMLRYGPRKRRLHLMLTDYRNGRRLFDEMQRRMTVPISISPHALGLLGITEKRNRHDR
jgi:hypothetical protein